MQQQEYGRVLLLRPRRSSKCQIKHSGCFKRRKEAQREFPISMEDFIRQSDISRSVQLAIGETKVRLDLAISLTKLLDWITTIDREKNHVK